MVNLVEKMHHLCIFLLLILSPFRKILPQPSQLYLVAEPVFHYGSIVPHHDFMHEFIEGPLVAGELKLGIQTTGKHAWERLYGYPCYGMGLYYGNIGNPEVLGNPFALYSFFDVPLIRGRHLSFHTQMALGMAAGFRPYHPACNPLNLAIGSRVNVFFYYNFYVGIALSDRLRWIHGANFTHFSNGVLTLPNTGFYLLDYFTSLQYTLYSDPPSFKKDPMPSFHPSHEFYLMPAAGLKKTQIEGRSWFASTLTLGYYYQIGPINKVGTGVDFFYDTSLQESFSETEPDFSDILRAGIFAGHELLIDRIGLVVNQGVYWYRKTRFYQQFYSRLAIRYHFPSGLIPSVAIKSHWGKADYIEWGLGYSF